jgi:hypothetical protein
VNHVTEFKKASLAVLGTADLAAEKARTLVDRARQIGGPEIVGFYEGLADRGESLVRRLQRSQPAKQAVDGTKQASRQLKGAATSVRKALGLEQQRASSRKAS